jgi:YhcH/YjgK/YiaL family protein
MSYSTEPAHERMLETHRRFTDLQLILAGREMIQWAPMTGLEMAIPCDDEKDLAFWKDAPSTDLVLGPGQFAIFLPDDAHKPNCSIDPGTPVAMKKLVVKIPVAGYPPKYG